jgi:hypothetical protein
MPAELVDYLADPPGWMVGQLAKLRKDPERWFKPTCASIAQEVYRLPNGTRGLMHERRLSDASVTVPDLGAPERSRCVGRPMPDRRFAGVRRKRTPHA